MSSLSAGVAILNMLKGVALHTLLEAARKKGGLVLGHDDVCVPWFYDIIPLCQMNLKGLDEGAVWIDDVALP